MPCSNCGSITTTGKPDQKGSWCTECGTKVYEVEKRECKSCSHYFKNFNYSGCKKHLMAVSPDMNVTYEIVKGTCFNPNNTCTN